MARRVQRGGKRGRLGRGEWALKPWRRARRKAMLTVTAMDHIVLNVKDMDTVLNFYINVLGLSGERIDAYHQGKVPFPSVRINADTLIDLFPVPATGTDGPASQPEHLNHFCMVIAKTEMQQVMAHLA